MPPAAPARPPSTKSLAVGSPPVTTTRTASTGRPSTCDSTTTAATGVRFALNPPKKSAAPYATATASPSTTATVCILGLIDHRIGGRLDPERRGWVRRDAGRLGRRSG